MQYLTSLRRRKQNVRENMLYLCKIFAFFRFYIMFRAKNYIPAQISVILGSFGLLLTNENIVTA